MKHWSLFLFMLMLLSGNRCFAEESEGVWITGQVFTSDATNSQLLFRADKPIKDNPAGNVVLLGTTRACANVFIPAYVRAAENHVTLRLFGTLQLIAPPPNSPTNAPNVQFITWKLHSPCDPDKLPESEKILINSNSSVKGDWIVTNPATK
jgi:hypothetical protein